MPTAGISVHVAGEFHGTGDIVSFLSTYLFLFHFFLCRQHVLLDTGLTDSERRTRCCYTSVSQCWPEEHYHNLSCFHPALYRPKGAENWIVRSRTPDRRPRAPSDTSQDQGTPTLTNDVVEGSVRRDRLTKRVFCPLYHTVVLRLSKAA